jgi:undecaprenyl-diphosphatase
MRTLHQLAGALRALYARLGFTVTAIVTFAAGLLALATAAVVFGGATEDVTQHNGLAHSDPAHLRFFVEHRSAALDQIARLATSAGAVAVVAVLAIAVAMFFWYRRLPIVLAVAPVVSLAIAAAATAVTKGIVGRTRPPVALHLVTETDASFPSGHATNSAAVFLASAIIAAVYVLRRPIARALIVLAAALATGMIGLSRLVLGVHWPSDVLAGWALGLAVALGVTMTLVVATRAMPASKSGGDTAGAWRRITQVLISVRQPRDNLQAI